MILNFIYENKHEINLIISAYFEGRSECKLQN